MSGKQILAGVFAVLILIKLAFLLISPGKWLVLSQAFLGHGNLVTGIYLVLLIVTGYYVFTSLDLFDVAVVMLFTGVLIGFSLIPYAATLQKVGQEIGAIGFGKAWMAWIIWVALAGAVLYKIYAGRKVE